MDSKDIYKHINEDDELLDIKESFLREFHYKKDELDNFGKSLGIQLTSIYTVEEFNAFITSLKTSYNEMNEGLQKQKMVTDELNEQFYGAF